MDDLELTPAHGPSIDGGCPVRKLSRPGEALSPGVERLGLERVTATRGPQGPRWVIRSYEVARTLIRSEGAVTQAGFGAGEFASLTSKDSAEPDARSAGPRRQPGSGGMRSPILYLEGAEHRQQRKAAARFFAPKTTESYRDMMDQLSEKLIAPLDDGAPVDVAALSLPMAVQVAARVVGLTDSALPGMAGRLEAFFRGDILGRSWHPRAVLSKLRSSTALLRFHHLDVKPAIRARRGKPGEDVISHLIQHGYTPTEILTECVTYAAAGMVTTREFITVASWHLLDDRELLGRYRAADRAGRLQILEEILRLEPVVGHLYHRTVEPMTVTWEGVEHELPVGTMLDLDIRAINADAATVGAEPLGMRPGRDMLGRGVSPSVMAFGDGNHRCPGAPIAMMESEIFLSRLFRDELVAAGAPEVSWSDLTEGYELRRLIIRRAA